MKVELDGFDRKLLSALQVDSRQTNEKLSEKVSLSQAACHRRVKNLRERGVIERDVAIVSPQAVGYSLTLIVHVTLLKEHGTLLDQFKRTMRDLPEVTQCYYITGTMDFTLIVMARDMQDYEEFTKVHFFGNRNVARFETNVVMNTVKFTTAVPIDGLEDD